MTAPEVPDLTDAKVFAYIVAVEDPERDRGERWFVLKGDEVWYRRTADAVPRKALISAASLNNFPSWTRVTS